MNRAKNLPNLFIYRQTGFSQCRKLFVDKPIRLRAVSHFARGVRVHACASIEQRSRETRDARNSPVTHLQSHACLRRFAPRTKKKETARSLQTNGHNRTRCNKTMAIMPGYETVPQQQASNKRHMLNKDLSRFVQSAPKSSKRKKPKLCQQGEVVRF